MELGFYVCPCTIHTWTFSLKGEMVCMGVLGNASPSLLSLWSLSLSLISLSLSGLSLSGLSPSLSLSLLSFSLFLCSLSLSLPLLSLLSKPIKARFWHLFYLTWMEKRSECVEKDKFENCFFFFFFFISNFFFNTFPPPSPPPPTYLKPLSIN